jgi:hypothetical protein
LPSFPQKALFRILFLRFINPLDSDKKKSFLRPIFRKKSPREGTEKIQVILKNLEYKLKTATILIQAKSDQSLMNNGLKPFARISYDCTPLYIKAR